MMKVCFKTETLMLQITAADLTASAAQLITNDKTTKGEKYLKKQKKPACTFQCVHHLQLELHHLEALDFLGFL